MKARLKRFENDLQKKSNMLISPKPSAVPNLDIIHSMKGPKRSESVSRREKLENRLLIQPQEIYGGNDYSDHLLSNTGYFAEKSKHAHEGRNKFFNTSSQ